MTVNPITARALTHAAEVLKYQNKEMQIKATEEHLRIERLRLQRIKPVDPSKGQNVDVTV